LKKSLYLFLALLLPGLIFVFLKYAGKNEFAVPIYYENGVDMPADCGIPDSMTFTFPGLYTIGHGSMIAWKMDRKVNLLVFPSDKLDFTKIKSSLDDEMGKNIVWIGKVDDLVSDTTGLSQMKKCIFLVKEPFQSVLFDDEGRIRGYYDLRSLKEIDRLRVELKILLKKY
jgi:hypothetical protein